MILIRNGLNKRAAQWTIPSMRDGNEFMDFGWICKLCVCSHISYDIRNYYIYLRLPCKTYPNWIRFCRWKMRMTNLCMFWHMTFFVWQVDLKQFQDKRFCGAGERSIGGCGGIYFYSPWRTLCVASMLRKRHSRWMDIYWQLKIAHLHLWIEIYLSVRWQSYGNKLIKIWNGKINNLFSDIGARIYC